MSILNDRASGKQPSIKYGWNQNAEIAYEVADFVHQDSNNDGDQRRKAKVHEATEILSTTQLISRACQVWNVARRPLSFFHPKSSFNKDERACRTELIVENLAEKSTSRILTSRKKETCINVGNAGHFITLVHSNFNSFSVSQKISVLKPCTVKCVNSSIQKVLLSGEGLSGIEVAYDIGKKYECMGRLYNPARVAEFGSCTIGEFGATVGVATASDAYISKNIDKLTSESDLKRSNRSSLLDLEISEKKTIKSPLEMDYFLNSVLDSETNGSINLLRISSIYSDYHINPFPSYHDPLEEFEYKGDDNEISQSHERQGKIIIIDDKCKTETFFPSHERCHNSLAKQEHAFAGALAGTCVSLCLHPVDTLKTVIQSCQAEKKSISYIGKSIISDRGQLLFELEGTVYFVKKRGTIPRECVYSFIDFHGIKISGLFGLYRGIATNIASSAPISAVYTFTYESVKGALLPLLPREYYSFAHCVAGGCASVATSFIFTPSERIKQQMQVSSNYPNCWNAVIEIVRKGGLSSLYTGWGAVLCRNIPHSIIKFYTYESLKEMIIPSEQSNAQPSTSQTLVCGGVAGSTAALFTTPFDVVKTRLQTQIPGSKSQYHNVIHALQEIGKKEGLKGLYRGLTPRLVMYMSQGAIFFASYEFFRRCFWVGDE